MSRGLRPNDHIPLTLNPQKIWGVSLITLEGDIHQGGVFGDSEGSKSGDQERKTVMKRMALLKLIFLLAVPLLIIVALAAGIKEFYPVRKPMHLG